MTQPRPIRLGPPLRLTSAEFDLAAEVTPFDVISARALWQQFAPARYLDLLDAMPEDFVGAT